MGLSHNIGKIIGAKWDIPHGMTSCITLPAGIADPLLEIQITKLDDIRFRREKNPKSGSYRP